MFLVSIYLTTILTTHIFSRNHSLEIGYEYSRNCSPEFLPPRFKIPNVQKKKKKKSSVLRTPIFEVSQDYSRTLQLILYVNILYAFFLYIGNKKNSFKKMLPTCSKTEKENAFKFHSAIFMLH